MMNRARLAVLLLSVVFLAPLGLGVAHAGELEFKRISCRDHIDNPSMFHLLQNSGVTGSTEVIVQVTRDTCRPTYRTNPSSVFSFGELGGTTRGRLRDRRAPLIALRQLTPAAGQIYGVYFRAPGATRISGTFDVKILFE